MIWKHPQGQVLRAKPFAVFGFAPMVAEVLVHQQKMAEPKCRMFDVC